MTTEATSAVSADQSPQSVVPASGPDGNGRHPFARNGMPAIAGPAASAPPEPRDPAEEETSAVTDSAPTTAPPPATEPGPSPDGPQADGDGQGSYAGINGPSWPAFGRRAEDVVDLPAEATSDEVAPDQAEPAPAEAAQDGPDEVEARSATVVPDPPEASSAEARAEEAIAEGEAAPEAAEPVADEIVADQVAGKLEQVVGEDSDADPAEFAAAAVLDVLRASGWADAAEAAELRSETVRLRELLSEVIRDHRAREASAAGTENTQLHWLVPLLRAAHGVAFGSLGAKVALRTAVQEVPPEVLAQAGLRIDYGVEPEYPTGEYPDQR